MTAERLQELAAKTISFNRNELSSFSKHSSLDVVRCDGPTCWKLCTSETEGNGIEEIVFSMLGIISCKDLPPFVNVLSKRSNVRYLRQSVQLTGCDTAVFTNSLDTLHSLHSLFERHFKEGTLDEVNIDIFMNFASVNLANRYFTSRRDDPLGSNRPFSRNVDPQNILSSMVTDKYFHGDDNEVFYYCSSDLDKTPSVKSTSPTMFRVGDIVTVQTTVVVVPIRNGRFKMILQLRSITLIDSKFSQMAFVKRNMSIASSSIPTVSIKRKIGYGQDEDEETSSVRRKLADLGMHTT